MNAIFDPPLCDRPFASFPLSTDWGALNWLKFVLLALFILAIGVAAYRIIQRFREHKVHRLRRFVSLVGIVAGILLIPVIAEKGLVLFLPSDPGTPADAIVILGRGSEFSPSRTELAMQLWQAKRAPIIFGSGNWDAPQFFMQLMERGIPESALGGEGCSQTTPENALFSAAILQTRGVEKILLVTDGPHMWRSMLDFQDQGLSVIPKVSAFPTAIGFIDKSFLLFREYLFLITSGLHDLINGHRIPNRDDPTLMELVRQAKAYAQQQ